MCHTYLIFAAGKSERWTGEVPKHLVDTYGEPLISRTARQLQELGISPIAVVNDEQVAEAVPSSWVYFMPHQSPNLVQNILDVRHLWSGTHVHILLGDVMFAQKTLERALDLPCFAYGATHEIFAVEWGPERETDVVVALTYAALCAMQRIGDGKMWNAYRVLVGVPIEEHLRPTDYLLVDEAFTRDFDFYDRYIAFKQQVKDGLKDPTI